MKRTVAAIAIFAGCMTSAAHADQKGATAGAAVGAVAGAVILGPIGAIGGAALGYVAGNSASSQTKASQPRRATRHANLGSTATQARAGVAANDTVRLPRSDPRKAAAATPPEADPPAAAAPRAPADSQTPPMQGFE